MTTTILAWFEPWYRPSMVFAGLVLMFGAAAAADPAASPSFDCKRAATKAEKIICADNLLAMSDHDLAAVWGDLRAGTPPSALPALLRDQRDWIARRNRCMIAACISNLYFSRQIELSDLAYNSVISRFKGGRCETAAIKSIGPRLEALKDAGTSVDFTNGLHQVSYGLEKPVLASRVGDPVRTCLDSLPRECPPHDHRGIEYRVTNLRTGAKWKLADSEHQCGGA